MKVYRIRGYLTHNTACLTAPFVGIPPQHIYPSVYRLALDQLVNGVSLMQVKSHNRTLVENRAYPGMSEPPSTRVHRYALRTSDTLSLYCQLSRLKGVNVDEKPEINVDEWMDQNSPRYNRTFADAIFPYQARAERGEIFEACVATADMKAAAWKYGHGKQILMDGTFGIRDRKVLLFVMMGVDEENKGVPLAVLFF